MGEAESVDDEAGPSGAVRTILAALASFASFAAGAGATRLYLGPPPVPLPGPPESYVPDYDSYFYPLLLQAGALVVGSVLAGIVVAWILGPSDLSRVVRVALVPPAALTTTPDQPPYPDHHTRP